MSQIGEPPVRNKAAWIEISEEDREKLAEEYRFAQTLPEPAGNGLPTGLTGSRLVGA